MFTKLSSIVIIALTASAGLARPADFESILSTNTAIRQSNIMINRVMGKVGTNKMFSCDPIFNSNGVLMSAMWYKDGVEIGEITNEENLIFENRTVTLEKPPPKVGFLIISNLQPQDEGDYWCIRKDTGTLGEISRIRIAFMTPVAEGVLLVSRPDRPVSGETVEVECASTTAFPVPAVSWEFNSAPLPVNSKHEVASNGSLLIHNYSAVDAGTYTCILTNFAGSTQASTTLSAPYRLPENTATASAWHVDCNSVKIGTTWFLLGCVSTIGLGIVYLLSGMIYYRLRNRRPATAITPTGAAYSNLWRSLMRADPALAPGFRKVIAPIPENPRLLATMEI
uniref:Ig-like domain-containing protein n=1 Tax=Panagrellus redivivus TaxID=6233 RepID=A0A7E4VQ95_PANRE